MEKGNKVKKELFARYLKEKDTYAMFKKHSLKDERWGSDKSQPTIYEIMENYGIEEWICLAFAWEGTLPCRSHFWHILYHDFRKFISDLRESSLFNKLYIHIIYGH